eukprot:g8968.t1
MPFFESLAGQPRELLAVGKAKQPPNQWLNYLQKGFNFFVLPGSTLNTATPDPSQPGKMMTVPILVRLEYEGSQQLVRLTVRTQHGEVTSSKWIVLMAATVPNDELDPDATEQCAMGENLRAALRFLAFECQEPSEEFEGPFLLPPRQEDQSDLDETLSHCRLDLLPDGPKPDFSVQFEESKATGYVYVRPFARLFLQVAARLFEAGNTNGLNQRELEAMASRLEAM